MKEQKICIPVMGKTLSELLANLEKAQELTPLIEIRADSLETINEEDIEKIKKVVKGEAIFTCRHVAEGGLHKVHEETRLKLLQKAIDIQFNYIDVELETCRTRKFTGTPSTKIIISYHNFIETPPYFDLTKIIDDIRSFHPDIMKIATMVKIDKDVISLTRVLVNKLPNDTLIILGMGDKGKITRLLQPYLGGYLTFASLDGSSSAPGQIDYKKLEELYKNINSLT
jgi:3-dehydroquinate dehydratase-1